VLVLSKHTSNFIAHLIYKTFWTVKSSIMSLSLAPLVNWEEFNRCLLNWTSVRYVLTGCGLR